MQSASQPAPQGGEDYLVFFLTTFFLELLEGGTRQE